VSAQRTTLRLAVIGLSGCGKSTTAGLVGRFAAENGISHAVVKLAKPLYDLQAEIYRAAGAELAPGAQDQVLLEQLADTLRRIRPDALVADFAARLSAVDADILVNDDLRDPDVDAPALRAHGFRILRITADPQVRLGRLDERADLSRAERSTARLDLIEPDTVLDNSGTLDELRDSLYALLRRWL
jgi:dephospho-CoA kinase